MIKRQLSKELTKESPKGVFAPFVLKNNTFDVVELTFFGVTPFSEYPPETVIIESLRFSRDQPVQSIFISSIFNTIGEIILI